MDDRSLVRLSKMRTHVGSVSLRQRIPKKKKARSVKLHEIPAGQKSCHVQIDISAG